MGIVQDCLYWGITPTQMLEMPLYWAEAGRIVRHAEQEAQAQQAPRKER